MTRKKVLWLVLPIQFVVVVLSVLACIAQQKLTDGFEILLFDRLILRHVGAWATVAILLAEAIMFFVLSIWCRKRKLLCGIFIALLMIFCVLAFVRYALDGWTIDGELTVYEYEEFEPDIVIENWQWLHAGGSRIYQSENGIVLIKITEVYGNDGYRPLANPDTYDVTVTDEGILYEYSNGNGVENGEQVYLSYKDGCFSCRK